MCKSDVVRESGVLLIYVVGIGLACWVSAFMFWREKRGDLTQKRFTINKFSERGEMTDGPSCNLFVLIPAYKKSKLDEHKILVVRSLFYSILEFCTMIERWHITEISTSDFTHHSVHSSCVHSLDHAGKDTLINFLLPFLVSRSLILMYSGTRGNLN
jgi:hypothetical protein